MVQVHQLDGLLVVAAVDKVVIVDQMLELVVEDLQVLTFPEH